MIRRPVRKSAVELPASRGEAEDHPSLFLDECWPPSDSDCSAVIFGHRYAWTRTAPIGVGRVQQVGLPERQT
jgi:hypothetical protein